jgi:hypothetical protein
MMDEKIAVLLARIACANLRSAGMQAENTERERNGLALAYGERAFNDVITEEGVGWNDICSLLYH